MTLKIGDNVTSAPSSSFTIDSEIDAGGFGKVFSATLADGSQVAIKALKTDDTKGVEREALRA